MGSTLRRRRRTRTEQPDRDARPVVARQEPDVLGLQALAGNRAVERVLTGTVHRCAPDRPGCACSPEERAERERGMRPDDHAPARRAGGAGWMAPEAAGSYRTGPRRAGPGDGSCGLEEHGNPTRTRPGSRATAAHRPAPQPPLQGGGAATIVCDGSGGYRADLRGWSGATCGIEGCVRRHEMSHAADWKRRWPNGCKGKKDGDAIPLGGKGYAAFLKKSECTAYTVELGCIRNVIAKNKDKGCTKTLRDHRKDTRRQRRSYC